MANEMKDKSNEELMSLIVMATAELKKRSEGAEIHYVPYYPTTPHPYDPYDTWKVTFTTFGNTAEAHTNVDVAGEG